MLLWFRIVARGDNMKKLIHYKGNGLEYLYGYDEENDIIHYEEIDQNDCIGGAIFNLIQQD